MSKLSTAVLRTVFRRLAHDKTKGNKENRNHKRWSDLTDNVLRQRSGDLDLREALDERYQLIDQAIEEGVIPFLCGFFQLPFSNILTCLKWQERGPVQCCKRGCTMERAKDC